MNTIFENIPCEVRDNNPKGDHAYEAENAWWYNFFQSAGLNNYDAEYANSLRIDGVLPRIAAEQARI